MSLNYAISTPEKPCEALFHARNTKMAEKLWDQVYGTYTNDTHNQIVCVGSDLDESIPACACTILQSGELYCIDLFTVGTNSHCDGTELILTVLNRVIKPQIEPLTDVQVLVYVNYYQRDTQVLLASLRSLGFHQNTEWQYIRSDGDANRREICMQLLDWQYVLSPDNTISVRKL
jgi:hypothetical protein